MNFDPNKLASKHTPGPWCVGDVIDENGRKIIPEDVNETGFAVAYGFYTKERDANANLISAAPEAIEFIADLLDTMSRPGIINNTYWINKGEEILKKAYNL